MTCNPESVIGELGARKRYNDDDFATKHWAAELGLTVPMFRSLPSDIQVRLKRVAVKKNTECQTYNKQMCQFEEEESLGYDFDTLDQLEEDVNREIDVSPKKYAKPKPIMRNKEKGKREKSRRSRIRFDSEPTDRHRYVPGSRFRPPSEPELPFIDKRPSPLIYYDEDRLPKDYHYKPSKTSSNKVPKKRLSLPESDELTEFDEAVCKTPPKKQRPSREFHPRTCPEPAIVEEDEDISEKEDDSGEWERGVRVSWYHTAPPQQRRLSAPGRVGFEPKKSGNVISWYHQPNNCSHYSDDEEYY